MSADRGIALPFVHRAQTRAGRPAPMGADSAQAARMRPQKASHNVANRLAAVPLIVRWSD